MKNNPFLKGALLTVLSLFGGVVLGYVLGNFVFNAVSGGQFANPAPMHITLAAIPALGGFLAGGGVWGGVMGRMAGATETRRLVWAGVLGFGPITLVTALTLAAVEPPLVARFGADAGIHRIFTLLFVPSAFLIAGVSAWAVGRGLRDNALARSLFWRVGLAGGLAFLAVNLLMQSLGWVVGAPGAAERATMLTVMALGDVAAAVAGGGLMGKMLAGRKRPA
jgi:hypothetical protein